MTATALRMISRFMFWLLAATGAACLTPTEGNGEGQGEAAGGAEATSAGGTTAASGGMAGEGGATSAGGVTSAGGATGMGGRLGTGGRTGTGGRSGTGGRRGTGGVTAAGGATMAGGTTASAGGSSASNTGTAGASGTTEGVRLVGREMVDCAGAPIIARGPEDVVASLDQTKDIDQAAALGANAMRMLFTLDAANGMTPAGFDKLLAQAVARGMLVWVSLYTWDEGKDHVIASGLGGGNFYSLAAPVGTACSSATPSSCYLAVWSRQWLKDLMNKYRCNVIIDAAQEFISPGDPTTATVRASWAAEAKTNIQFFREQGYTNPLEIMANYQGRDLYGIVEHGEAIRAADRVTIDGEPQTMFGWQAYWGTKDGYYPQYQGALLLGKQGGVVTGPEAINQFAATRTFPIQIGIDNYATDTNLDYQAEIDQAAADGMSWLWWSWRNGGVECPVSGSACVSYVTTSPNGFKGAKPLSQ